jgi:hypothetical protein
MKKYLLLLLLCGCSNEIKYPLVVIEVSHHKGQKNFIRVEGPAGIFGDNKYFWSDSVYHVGDTLR